VHVLPVRAGQHPQRTVVRGGIRDRQPRADLGSPVEREVEGILVPRLAEGAGELEDELREEAVEIGPDPVFHPVEQLRVLGERPE